MRRDREYKKDGKGKKEENKRKFKKGRKKEERNEKIN